MKKIFEIKEFIVTKNEDNIFFLTNDLKKISEQKHKHRFETKNYIFCFEKNIDEEFANKSFNHIICLAPNNKLINNKFFKGELIE